MAWGREVIMAEQIVYFNPEHHTGHLREAAAELLDQDLQVVDLCAERVRSANPSLSPWRTPALVRLAISPQTIPDKTKARWERTEVWVTRLLVSAHMIRYPHIAYMKLSEYMDGVSLLNSLDDALGFLALRRHRLEYFLSA